MNSWLILFGALLLLGGFSAPPARGQVPAATLARLACLPDSGAAPDYRALGAAVGSAQVVLLGEQTHFDGATFKAKIDIIRYLHDSLGFNVLAFEGDFYGLDKAQQERRAGRPALPALQAAVFEEIWSGTNEFKPLADLLDARPRLALAGVDCQLTSQYTEESLLPELRRFLAAHDRAGHWPQADFRPADEWLAELTRGDLKQFLRPRPADSLRLGRWRTQVRRGLRTIAARQPAQAGRAAFWQQWLRSTTGYFEDAKAALRGPARTNQNPRDALMADNLLFLARQAGAPKIMVWAASYHNANRLELADLADTTTARYFRQAQRRARRGTAPEEDEEPPTSLAGLLGGAVPMGRAVKARLGPRLYAIGFTAYEGTYGQTADTTTLTPVPVPPAGSLEQAFADRGCATGFVDLRGGGPGSYHTSALGYLPIRAPWGEVFDGLVFTQQMYPTSKLGTAPPAPPVAAGRGGRRLAGHVRDAKTGAPVPFASIGLAGTGLGTVANADGAFAFYVPAEHARKTLVFSALGYAPQPLAVAGLRPGSAVVVPLVPQLTLLGEVVVRAPLAAAAVVARARQQLATNYAQVAHGSRLYFRYGSQVRDTVQLRFEAALAYYDPTGYQRGNWLRVARQKRMEISQVRKQTAPGYRGSTRLPELWTVWSNDPVLTPDNLLSTGPAAKYDFTHAGRTQHQGRDVYAIAFECRKPSAYTTCYGYPAPATYRGSIYIDAENFAVVKYEAFTTWEPDEVKKPKIYRRWGLTQPARYTRQAHDIYQYQPTPGGYVLQYVRRHYTTAYENLADGQDRHRRQEVSELLTTAVEFDHPRVLPTPLIELDDRPVAYNQGFWDIYQVLLPESSLGQP